MGTLIEPDDMHPTAKPYLQYVCVIDGSDAVEHVVCPAHQHPRMRLIADAAFNLTFNLCTVFATSDAVIAVKKGRDRKTVAACAGGAAAAGDVEKFTPSAEAAGVNKDITIFERYDDVVVQATTAGNAGSSALVDIAFEVLE